MNIKIYLNKLKERIIINNMSYMFYDCKNLFDITDISNWTT